MKRLVERITPALVGVFLLAGCALAQQTLKLPEYQKTQLANGMKVILMKQTEVPLVSISVGVRAGSLNDPAGREGLSSVTAELLRKGTRSRTASQLSAQLDFVGGTLDFTAGPDFVRGQAEFLKKDLAIGLDLLSDVLVNPAFPVAEVEKLIKQRIDTVKQAKDQAQSVIANYYQGYLFGNHPYARPADGDERSLAAIKRLDVVNFYNSNYGPQSITIVIVGDFDPENCLRLLNERFSRWQQKKPVMGSRIAVPETYRGTKLLLVDKPDSTQTYFMIGNVGIDRHNPDRVALEVVNTVFGGRFTSMLNEALRVNTGLTYGAASRFVLRQVPGPFFISTYTQNKTTVQTIDMALEILRKLHEDALTPEQLKSAKAYIKGQYPTRVETSNQLADLLVDFDYYGLQDSELTDYFTRIDAVTPDDIRRVIAKHYPLDNLVFVLIGKADEIREQVRKYAVKLDEKKINQPGY